MTFRHRVFNRPKKGRCLLKKHTHTIDIHIKKKNNRVRWHRIITNNTQKETTKLAHISEESYRQTKEKWPDPYKKLLSFFCLSISSIYNQHRFKILDLPKICTQRQNYLVYVFAIVHNQRIYMYPRNKIRYKYFDWTKQ